MLWLFAALAALFAAAVVFTFFAIKVLLGFWLMTLVILPFWVGAVVADLIHPLVGLVAGGVVFWGGWQVNRWLMMSGGSRRKRDPD